MRDFEFRGKSMGWYWVYGLLTKKKIRSSGKLEYAIANDDFSLANTVPIHEETIGQFTGNYDCYDKKIFEDDLIQDTEHEENIYRVTFIGGCWVVTDIDEDIDSIDTDEFDSLAWTLDHGNFAIIGNIYDNKELLKGANNA